MLCCSATGLGGAYALGGLLGAGAVCAASVDNAAVVALARIRLRGPARIPVSIANAVLLGVVLGFVPHRGAQLLWWVVFVLSSCGASLPDLATVVDGDAHGS